MGILWLKAGRMIDDIPGVAEARLEPRTFLCFLSAFGPLLHFAGLYLLILGRRGLSNRSMLSGMLKNPRATA